MDGNSKMDTQAPEQGLGDQQLTGAEIVLRALADQGVDTMFGYPGGAVLPIYDAIYAQQRVRHILVRHEQAPATWPKAMRARPASAALRSPLPVGATNMVTPLADALMDLIPMVVFTGQVPTHLIGSDAFQEADTVGITRACTKHNYLVRDVNDLARTIHEAFYVATHGRPGPVLVDIPKNVQFAKGRYVGPEAIEHRTYHPRTEPQDKRIEEALALMATAQRPIIYSGGGVINSGPAASESCVRLRKPPDGPSHPP